MLNYNEIKEKKVIVHSGEPWEVINSHIFRKQQRKPVNQTTLKNLITGRTIEHSFHQSDKVDEADVTKRDAKFLYQKGNEFWFCAPDNPKDRFMLGEEIIGSKIQFMNSNTVYPIRIFNDDFIFDIELPIKDVFEVVEAPPNVKGGTASGSSKHVKISTGATISTPFFIEKGDKIVVNIQEASYVERYKGE